MLAQTLSHERIRAILDYSDVAPPIDSREGPNVLPEEMGCALQILRHGTAGIIAVNHRDAQTSSHDQGIGSVFCSGLEGHDTAERQAQVGLQLLHCLNQCVVA